MTRTNEKAPRPITDEIAELRGLTVAELMDRYETLFGKTPRSKHKTWLWRRCAWRLQEQRLGGLSTVAKRKLDELFAEIDLPLVTTGAEPKTPVRRVKGEPQIGTSLVRVWRDQEVHATRTEEGWEYGGVVYGSLSALAKAATGSHRSGLAFFGLTKRRLNGTEAEQR